MHKELSKQTKIVNEAEKYQKERNQILANNEELQQTVKQIEKEYNKKTKTLDINFINRQNELEKEFETKAFNLEYEYKNKYRKLEKENNHLQNIIERFQQTIEKFIKWICYKFNMGEPKELIKDFEKETHTLIDPVKQLKKEEVEKELDLER